ncbi:MAG: T9SS type A sorting domain-containing protein [Methylococcaceae bacterium]
MFKQLSFLVALFLSNLLIVCGQDWQTVRSGRIAYFDKDQGLVKSLRIDSVKFDRDSVLYPMANIQQIGPNCITPKGNSWIGKKVIIQNNGVNLFFNNNNDTIRINTRAKVGDSWTLFEIKDSIKITAEVKSAEIQPVIGEMDSIKTIGLKVYEKNVLKEHHYLSDKWLVISKNYGFVWMMNFNVFPEVPNSSTFEILESFNLIGLSHPNLGVQNLTWLGVHDYGVDDELHVVSNTWNWSVNPGYRNEVKTIWKILERIESIDSVYYRIERKESLKKSIERWDNISYTFTHDTINAVYKPDFLFDKLPGEPIVSDYGADANVMFNEGAFIKKLTSYMPIQKLSIDSCWYYIFYDGGDPGYYLKGLGGPYYNWNEIISGDDRSLVYYKKGAATWGTPLVITGVQNLEKENQVKIYPNPATDFVTIENPTGRTENCLLQLIDMQGREVLKNSITITNSYRLDLSSLTEGAYLLKLENGEKQISRMIIKKD